MLETGEKVTRLGFFDKMNPKIRRLLQAVFVVALVAYTTLLAYQSLSRGTVNTVDVSTGMK